MVGRNPGLLAMRPAQVRYYILCIYMYFTKFHLTKSYYHCM